MRLKWIVGVSLWATVALAQQRADSIRADRLRADVTFLSSTALERRKSLERGSEVTIEFLAADFAKAGLKPDGGNSYLQEVPLVELRVRPAGNRLAIAVSGQARQLERRKDFFGTGFRNEGNVDGAVVFAGYGITAPALGYDDYAGVDVRGKIVLIFDHEPQETDPRSVFDGLGNTLHASPYMKILNAERHGAVAVLTVGEPNRKHPTFRELMSRLVAGAEDPATRTRQVLADGQVHIGSFIISDAVAAELLAVTGKTPGELQAAIDASLKPASQSLSGVSAELEFAPVETSRKSTFNVIGVLEGRDPRLREETILFTAHHDHLGTVEGAIRPGANDNASGVAGLIELAREFARERQRRRRTLVFSAFGAEEPGLLGSHYYTMHPVRPLARTRAVLNLDMIGSDEQPTQQTTGLNEHTGDTPNDLNLIGLKRSPGLRAVLERANRQVGLRLSSKWDDEAATNSLFRSDHFPFLLEGVPAVLLIAGATPDYHQPTDTVEKLNFAKMERIVRLAYLAGRALAEQ